MILDSIGNTPLIEIKSISDSERNVRVYAKAEFLNLSGSVKDRAAKAMVLDGIKSGKLTKDKIILDATSGNTGIAYAMLGSILGYKVLLCMPSNVTSERKKIMKAYGAEIIETNALEGIDGAYNEARHLAEENPDMYFYPDQYSNEANWKAHYYTTAEEIWNQTKHRITHFVCGTGTSGTFTGCTRKLKELKPDICSFIMCPDSIFHGIEGVKHTSAISKGSFFDESLADGTIEISTETAYKMTEQLAKKDGLFVGISSGANVAAAAKIVGFAPSDSVIVTVLCDSGCRYFSSPVFKNL
ncbi:MAG: cysteine synthase family protein [Clostridia bacterium]|nr:cysteine synthase family protein [Clostridia bacterium]